MAMGKAVVCTAQSLEGIHASNGVDVVVADSPGDFAARVLSLVQTPGLAADIGQSARRCVERGYSWEANLRPLDALLNAGEQPARAVGVRS
jgi:glycosyltransferase involved in cell wall biosynthesis